MGYFKAALPAQDSALECLGLAEPVPCFVYDRDLVWQVDAVYIFDSECEHEPRHFSLLLYGLDHLAEQLEGSPPLADRAEPDPAKVGRCQLQPAFIGAGKYQARGAALHPARFAVVAQLLVSIREQGGLVFMSGLGLLFALGVGINQRLTEVYSCGIIKLCPGLVVG